MRIRLAKVGDAGDLARVHWVCAAELKDSFMYKLGVRFLHAYYNVVLREKSSVVLCAEDDQGRIIGVYSGTTDSAEHTAALKRNRLRLLVASLPGLVRYPSLLGGLIARFRSVSGDQNEIGFVMLTGARGEFWGWLPEKRGVGGALIMHSRWLSIMRALGARRIQFEVDEENQRVVKLHLAQGARVVKKYVTPDGKARLLMEYPDDSSADHPGKQGEMEGAPRRVSK